MPARQEDVACTEAMDQLAGMFTFPFVGEAPEQHQGGRHGKIRGGAHIGAQQEVEPLEGRVAPHIEEDRVCREGMHLASGIGH